MPGHGPIRHRRLLTARNDGGLRTVVYTSGGPGMVTDTPVSSGGSGTALTPLETVLGALCGSTGATLATVAREAGFGYDGATFEASFTLDPQNPAAQPGARTYFRTVRVEIQVRAARPGPRLADVARVTEQRCPIRNLLADAGVTVDMIWTVASPRPPPPKSRKPSPSSAAPSPSPPPTSSHPVGHRARRPRGYPPGSTVPADPTAPAIPPCPSAPERPSASRQRPPHRARRPRAPARAGVTRATRTPT